MSDEPSDRIEEQSLREEEFRGFFNEVYREQILEAASEGQDHIVIDCHVLDKFDPELLDELINNPEDTLQAAEEALSNTTFATDTDMNVRFSNLPSSQTIGIRNLRSDHLHSLVEIEGIIRRASEVRPEIIAAKFRCLNCGTIIEKEQESTKLKKPYQCSECGSKMFDVKEKLMRDVQILTVEENPEEMEGNTNPSRVVCFLRDELVDPTFQKNIIPGNKVSVTGVLEEMPRDNKKKTQLYDMSLEASYVEPLEQEFEDLEITAEEEKQIQELAQDGNIFNKISNSMAPSIYGMHHVKQAVALQMFGGVRKQKGGGHTIRGDIHIALLGEPGTGKCVAPDTRVTLPDGREKPIQDIVESRLDDPEQIEDGWYQETSFQIPSLTHSGSQEQREATKVWKREAPDTMYRITTRSGKQIEVTPSHPLFTVEDGIIQNQLAEDLRPGNFIATPRRLNTEGHDELDLSFRRSQSNNAVEPDVPDALTPQLSRLLAYIVAEGYVQDRDTHCSTVYITNNDREIINDIKTGLNQLGVNHSERSPHNEKSGREVLCSSSEFVSFLKALEPRIVNASQRQVVPPAVMRGTTPVKKAFLKAFIDSEGTVSPKQREITVSSTSKTLLEQVRSLLLSCGLQSQLQSRNPQDAWRLRITGEDAVAYARAVGFVTERKLDAANQFPGNGFNPNHDVIPGIHPLLEETRKKLRLSQFECGIPRGTFQHYERRDRQPTHGSLENIVNTFKNRLEKLEEMKHQLADPDWTTVKQVRTALRIPQTQVAAAAGTEQTVISAHERGEYGENTERLQAATQELEKEIRRASQAAANIAQLEAHCDAAIYWDEIVSIESVHPDYDWVYDLEIEDTHNFISNNIYSHNSQILQFASELAPKGKYVVGKSATGAGVTATAVKDEIAGGWSLEAGALVLANGGMATIDEIDKMGTEDRSALHEAMEQQQITVSKATIQATLQCKAAILAAGNPKHGRFDPYGNIAEQIDLSPTLISRFDLIFPVKDVPNKEKDEKLANHILDLHQEEEEEIVGEINFDLLKKYIAYARRNVRPTLTDEARAEIENFYTGLRSLGVDDGEAHSVPITARQLEALVRMAEASAKTRLSETVEVKDAKRGIELLKHYLQQIGMDPESGQIDIDKIEVGITSSQRNKLRNTMDIIKSLAEERGGEVQLEEVKAEAESRGIDDVNEIIQKLKQEGTIYEPKAGVIGVI